jgi:lipid-A-disaccharide synthase
MVYRVSRLTWRLGRPLVSVPYFAMPNLIAGQEVVPELVQDNFTPENIVARMNEILADGPARQSMLEGLKQVRAKLAAPSGAGSASDRAAEAVFEALGLRH